MCYLAKWLMPATNELMCSSYKELTFFIYVYVRSFISVDIVGLFTAVDHVCGVVYSCI